MTDRSVLLVGNFLSGTRAHRHYCEDLAVRLVGADWNVITTSRHAGKVAKLADMLATTWRTRSSYDVAVVDVFSRAAFFWAEAVCLELVALRKPFVLALRGGSLPEFARRWPGRVRRLLASASLVTAPSGFLRDALSAYSREIEVLPNGIGLANYPFVPRSPLRPRLVWLRAFHEVYNPSLALEVLHGLKRAHPDATLLMVGPDRGGLQSARELARSLGLAASVEIVGGVAKEEVPSQLARGDIYLNTSNIDNTPITVLEAMACGLPVVTTDVGGIPHLVEHERTGILVPPRDPSAMTMAVSRLLADDSLATRIVNSARTEVEQRDWSAVVRRWDAVLTAASADA